MAIGSLINGKLFDFSSVEIKVGGIVNVNVSEINYSHGLDPGYFRGTSAMWSGRTRGVYDTDGSFTMYKQDYNVLTRALAALGLGGYMEAEFLITVMYREVGATLPITDQLQRCRIKHDEDSHSSGNDPIVVKADLSIFQILRDGVPAVSPVGGSAAGIVGGLIP